MAENINIHLPNQSINTCLKMKIERAYDLNFK